MKRIIRTACYYLIPGEEEWRISGTHPTKYMLFPPFTALPKKTDAL